MTPASPVESDYYRKAVAWDSTLEQGRRNVALGWQVAPTLGPVGRGRPSQLVLDVRDSAGRRVRDARVTIEARQVAHAADVVRATLSADSSGGLRRGIAARSLRSVWEMRIVATRGSDRYASSVRLLASESASASTSMTGLAIHCPHGPGPARAGKAHQASPPSDVRARCARRKPAWLAALRRHVRGVRVFLLVGQQVVA